MRSQLLFFSMLGLAACSTAGKRGVVKMKVSDTRAHVDLGKQNVQVGDRLTAIQRVCVATGGGTVAGSATSRTCSEKRVGSATVVGTLNQHQAVVEYEPGIEFEEGSAVEVP